MGLPETCYDYRPERAKPLIIDRCSSCGSAIYEGEEYFDINRQSYCKECVENSKKEAERETEW